jgi:hypothetical protein
MYSLYVTLNLVVVRNNRSKKMLQKVLTTSIYAPSSVHGIREVQICMFKSYVYSVRYVLWYDVWTPEVCSQKIAAETSITKQRFARLVSAATDGYGIIGELLEVVICVRFAPKL